MVRNIWILLTVFDCVLMALFAGRAGTNTDTMFSYGLLVAVSLGTGLIALRAARRRIEDEGLGLQSSWDLVWKKLRRNRLAMVGMWVVVALVYISMLAPFIVPFDPYAMDWGAISLGPGAPYYFGTDEFGRDILSRAIYGTRVAVGIGLVAVCLNTLIGTVLGLLAGYYGGRVDSIIMRAVECWNSIPFILMAIALMAALGTGIFNLILVVSLTGIMEFARIIRGDTLLLREADYVSAAKVMGIPDMFILLRHILPNCLAPIIVLATLRIGETILTVAGLSFLGLGIQAPTPSLGSMLSNGQQYLYENVMMSVVPGTLILLVVLAFNLFGDGLRDALDSKITD